MGVDVSADNGTPEVSWTQVRHFRMERSGLIEPFATPEEVAIAHAGIQAQIHPAAGLALQNRTPTGKGELTNARYESALYESRTLIKLWGQRGTLHLYASSDWPLMIGSRSVDVTWWERQWAKAHERGERLSEETIALEAAEEASHAQANAVDQIDQSGIDQSEISESGIAVDTTTIPNDSEPIRKGGMTFQADSSDEILRAFDYAKAADAVIAALAERPSMGRSELRSLNLNLPEEYYSPWGGIFHNLVRTGWVCHAARVGGEGHFAHRTVWLPNLVWNPPGGEDANVELLRRFFRTYGPATEGDVQYWRYGPPKLRPYWMARLAPELAEVRVEGHPMFVLRNDVETLLAQPNDPDAMPVRMLYRFDPLLLAHRDRSWLVDDKYGKSIARAAGHIEGIVMHRGRAIATWRYERKGKGLRITVEPFNKMPKSVANKLPKLGERVARFFALKLEAIEYAET